MNKGKKYKILKKVTVLHIRGRKLYRIQALKDFGIVKKGDIGGWIEKESNLSQEGDCWIYNNAIVCESAKVFDNAEVRDSAVVCEAAEVFDNSYVIGNSFVSGGSKIYGNALVKGKAFVSGEAHIYENAIVEGNSNIIGKAKVYKNAIIITGEVTKDIFENGKPTKEYIEASLGTPFVGEYIFVYARVLFKKRRIVDAYSPEVVYPKRGWIKNKFVVKDIFGFSHPHYYCQGDGLLLAKVKYDDIIDCNEGRIIVNKAYVISVGKSNVSNIVLKERE